MPELTVAPSERSLTVSDVLGVSFPSADLALVAAAELHTEGFDSGQDAELREGPHWRVEIGPGLVQLVAQDLAKVDRKDRGPAIPRSDKPSRSVITEWSAKSRANMVRRLAGADYAPLLSSGYSPVMVTLTYPGDWLSVAPDGSTVKTHLDNFRRAWLDKWGSPLVGVWKLEFQRRGAPHFHLLVSAPATASEFRLWVSETWNRLVFAGVEADPDERMRHLLAGTGVDVATGSRMRDPRRVAVYFLKHGTKTHDGKGYQNVVPEPWQAPGSGPGRFWGMWGLGYDASRAYVDVRTFVQLRRLLRRWARANHRNGAVRGGRMAGCWFAVNDGPAFAFALSRALASS